MRPSVKKCYPSKIKKSHSKKIGIISCITTGLFYLYQLIFCDGEITPELPGVRALQERVKIQIKTCVKEALIEYELERGGHVSSPTATSSSITGRIGRAKNHNKTSKK